MAGMISSGACVAGGYRQRRSGGLKMVIVDDRWGSGWEVVFLLL